MIEMSSAANRIDLPRDTVAALHAMTPIELQDAALHEVIIMLQEVVAAVSVLEVVHLFAAGREALPGVVEMT